MTQAFNPYFILGSFFFFLAVINLFDITKRSKWLNRIGNTGNTCKSYTVVGALAYMLHETDIWVQIGRGKVGLSGNIQVKSYIPKSKFDNVFDIRKSHSLYIHNVRKIHLLGFSVQRLWGKSLAILGLP